MDNYANVDYGSDDADEVHNFHIITGTKILNKNIVISANINTTIITIDTIIHHHFQPHHHHHYHHHHAF